MIHHCTFLSIVAGSKVEIKIFSLPFSRRHFGQHGDGWPRRIIIDMELVSSKHSVYSRSNKYILTLETHTFILFQSAMDKWRSMNVARFCEIPENSTSGSSARPSTKAFTMR